MKDTVDPGVILGQKGKINRDTFPLGGNGSGGASFLSMGAEIFRFGNIGIFYPFSEGSGIFISCGFTGDH